MLSNSTLATLVAGCRSFGGRIAIISNGRSLSYEELDDRVSGFAHALATMGVVENDVVTIHGASCWQWVVAYHGAMRLGAVVNPVNALLTPDEVSFIRSDCSSRLLIADAERLARATSAQGLPAVSFDDVATLSEKVGRHSPATRQPDDLATICYTSGTTGRPKGAMLTHRNIIMNSALTGLMHGRASDDVTLTALPLAHVYGNVVMNGTLLAGGTLVLIAPFDATQVLSAIGTYGATRFEGVPTMYYDLLGSDFLKDANLKSLKLCTVGGQTMPVERMEAVEQGFGCPLIELWGMSEIAGLGSTFCWTGPRTLGSIGFPLPGIQLKVADPETGKALPPDTPGQLQIRGPIVMRGYLNNPEATADVLDVQGWLSTGDIARIDSDGQIFIVDRAKDVILTSGNNVYPAEVERVIAMHESVLMVAVGRDNHARKGEIAHAYVVLHQGRSCTESEIVALCREHLAPYKVPAVVSFVDDLPRNSTGKILRRALGSAAASPEKSSSKMP